MDNMDNTLHDFNNDTPPAPPSSKLGLIGLVLGGIGFIVFCLPMTVAFFAGALGVTDQLGESGLLGISLIGYCGVFISFIGAVLGGVSLVKGENKTYGIISIGLGVLLLCTCGVLFVVGMSL